MKAFPQNEKDADFFKRGGMDLRDYFAAKAMQAIMTNSTTFFPQIAKTAEKQNKDPDLIMAQLSYVYADSMMKAREQ